MKDSVEDFIDKHRGEFDDLQPNAQLWDKIESELVERYYPKRPKYLWVWRAVAMIFICLSILLLVERSFHEDDSVMANYQELNPEIENAEVYYNQVINQRKTQILKIINQSEIVDTEILSELDDLDLMYSELKDQLHEDQNNDKLISAMIRNLQLRVEILNKQLQVLEQLLNYEKNEKISA